MKARLSELVDRVERESERIVMTRDGRPAAVIVSADDLATFEETLEVLSDRELLETIREGERAAAEGDVFALETVDARTRRRG